ncbi:MAG: hypothetical protein V8Q84_01225 [Bilophila sp.]
MSGPKGFRHYLDILREELENNPEGYGFTLRNLRAVPLGKSACYVEGGFLDRPSALPDGGTHRLDVRFTAVCVVQADGECRIRAVHASLPCGAQGEGEYFPAMLLGEGGQSASSSGAWRSAFELLQASLPGGLVRRLHRRRLPPITSLMISFLEHLGYTYDEFVKETRGIIDNAIHPGRPGGRGTEIVTEAFRHTDRYEVTYRMRKKDGSYTLGARPGPGRTVTDEGRDAIVCIIIDVTDIPRAARAAEAGRRNPNKAKNAELEYFNQIIFSGFAKTCPTIPATASSTPTTSFSRFSATAARNSANCSAIRPCSSSTRTASAPQDAAIRSRGGRFSVKFRCATPRARGTCGSTVDACRSRGKL